MKTTLYSKLLNQIEFLPTVCFALPMSTGIISIATYLLGFHKISTLLFWINNVELILFLTLLFLRIMMYPHAIKKDFSNPSISAGFLTLVAALCIYGTKNVLVKSNFSLAFYGWSMTFLIWIIFIYGFIASNGIKKIKPAFKDSINGTWLLTVVSIQALSISGNLIASHFGIVNPDLFLFLTLGLFLLGALFYIVLISLIFYRIFFYSFQAKDFKPSYWINMGAAAISTLSGAILVKTMNDLALLQEMVAVIKVFALFFWFAGTWWIPLLIFWEIKKRRTIKVRYQAAYWSLVFPLGVYTVCTLQLGLTLDIPLFLKLASVTIWIAVAVWSITFLQMLRHLLRKFFVEN